MNSPDLYLVGLVIFLGNYDLSNSLKMRMIPQVPTVSYIDNNYAEDVILKTRRKGRGGEYALSLEYTLIKAWMNHNVSLHFIFYEYLHNEYKPSFIEMHFRICDVILKDKFIGAVLRKTGLTVCPLLPGRYHLMNMTFNEEFPSVWPFEKGKCELTVKVEPSGKVIARGDVVLVFQMIIKP